MIAKQSAVYIFGLKDKAKAGQVCTFLHFGTRFQPSLKTAEKPTDAAFQEACPIPPHPGPWNPPQSHLPSLLQRGDPNEKWPSY